MTMADLLYGAWNKLSRSNNIKAALGQVVLAAIMYLSKQIDLEGAAVFAALGALQIFLRALSINKQDAKDVEMQTKLDFCQDGVTPRTNMGRGLTDHS